MKSIVCMFALLVPAALLGAGCACKCPEPQAAPRAVGHAHAAHPRAHQGHHPRPTVAFATLRPTAGHNVRGTVRFEKVPGGVKVVADVEGLTPNTAHGFHIHQYGDCSKPDGTSAGGHYNPEGHHHAGPSAASRHAGDLGNIQADAAGHAHLELTVTNITIAGWHNPILGRGLIVHKGPDDLKTQPTGAAGPRVACGVIGVVPSR